MSTPPSSHRGRADSRQSEQLHLDRLALFDDVCAGGISMWRSACDMLVMSPEALKAGTARPSTTRTV